MYQLAVAIDEKDPYKQGLYRFPKLLTARLITPLTRAIVVGLTTFAASALGMGLQDLVAPDVLTASKGAVGAMIGLVSLLLALVLGLLVYTAFSVFTSQQSEAYSLGPIVADIDLALEHYGPEGASGRAGLRASLERSRVRFFGDAEQGPRPFTFEEMKTIFAGLDGYFDSLQPATERQRRLLTRPGTSPGHIKTPRCS